MLFNSYIFIFFFLPISVGVFLILAKAKLDQWALTWAVLISLIFYGWWEPYYVVLMLLSILGNYSLGALIGKTERANFRLSLTITGVSLNLLLLGFFKYFNFSVENVNSLFGTNYHLEQIILPIAISFFTFEQIAYIVDRYRERTPSPRFLHYSFFVSFFPQLIAGPIAHHKEIIPQIKSRLIDRIDGTMIVIGISIFCVGLFKKVMIADKVAEYSTPIYTSVSNGETIGFWESWVAAFGYTFQIYFDFSAYSDMAIGIACLFGVRLPQNFNSPYKATSIIEFWRRWHMTLSRFLRDYLYFLLGGNRKGNYRRYTNLMITMLLGGLWHGAGWGFVLWGALHGIFLSINHIWRKLFGSKSENLYSFIWATSSRFLTLICIVFTWVLFRTESVSLTLEVYGGMFGINGAGDFENFTIPIFFIIILWIWVLVLPNSLELFGDYIRAKKDGIVYSTNKKSVVQLSWKPSKNWALLLASVTFISIINLAEISEFIYFQF
ncbi:MBOAT family protein [Alphaproteobacteria bacterium]|nr:MBOAT family protein [Alphaproteobacteria bacterium]